MEKESFEVKNKEKAGCNRFFRVIKRMSLKGRLLLAFAILIISSASATIMIGTMVFGQKVDELAREKAYLYIKYSEEVFKLRMQKMRILVELSSVQVAGNKNISAVFSSIKQEIPVDFMIYVEEDKSDLLYEIQGGDSNSSINREVTLSGNSQLALRSSSFFRLVELARKTRKSVSGLAVLGKEEMNAIGLNPLREENTMFILSVGQVPLTGDFLIIGYVVNGREDILRRIEEFVAPGTKMMFGATIFLGGERVATILGEKALGSQVDAKVATAVLSEGNVFTGIAKVLGQNFYTSYIPLKDIDGKILGMIGVGTNEDVYTEVRNRTTKLFTNLIAGGMVFGFIMMYLFSTWLVKPIALLAGGMSRVAEGDLNYKVRIETADELGRLARAFNQMVKAVKERDHKLREMTENRLSTVEKQISIGRLAAGVAHEINNPLTAILSLSSLMLRKLPEDDPRKEDLEIVVQETTRCREIVRSLLDFARERPAEKLIVNVNNVISDTIHLTNKYEAMKKVEVVVTPPGHPFYVSGDPKQLQQVFTNLLINAAEAADKGGKIWVSVDEDSSGGFVNIRFKDNGKGIPKEHLNRVFEPFFTTKGTGKGTGLGLSVSLGIIQKHDGVIELESEEGKGTTVTVCLPRAVTPQSA